MGERVCAVVVTYNRKNLLGPCLQSLLVQTRPLDRILVVDNASTDGTPDFVRQNFPQLTLMRLDRNSGGAGGFHHGMKRSYEEGFDWVWVMDDDIQMVPNALKTLLTYGEFGDLINPRKRHSDGVRPWESVWNTSSCYPITLERDESFHNGKPWTAVAYANFEGALIRRLVMERAGFPDIRYFVGGDDTMYGLRAHFHARVIYVDFAAVIKHVHSLTPRSKMSFYLHIRNRFLHFQHFREMGIPVSRPEFVLQTLKVAILDTAQILRNKQLRTRANFQALWAGFFDGLHGTFGPPPWIK